ncbi:MAG: Queuine tRNA-ribosyltransferase [Chlamydiales bacterium]|nr:Queuine tRNA-ribosyltransferase [Chlamydiales bacterium]MCH9635864.1 Queuine tRNA-ribosyltransferase [Chlamydiales bacterium]MCH9703915.1 tRNA-guanosine(34) transglycosylase [Chlamydiota bacterium]
MFEVLHKSKKSGARVGRIHTPHGVIDTPNFVAVGTNGTLKAIGNDLVDKIGLQLMFCNTYHLLVQPGPEIVKEAGGLHKFMGRSKPLITDSGGFQVFSLAYGSVHDEIKSRGKKKHDGSVEKISEEGVIFRSYRDGRKIHLTPESSIQAQKDLGADIIIPFDELPPYHIEVDDLKKSLARTHRWEMRSLQQHLKSPNKQMIYGVIHGGICPDLRKHSCETLTKEAFDGFAIGGSVGKNKQELFDVVKHTRKHLPDEKPNHLLGIGDLPSLEQLIPLGIDTFDSSYPTKAARHGLLLTDDGGVKIEQQLYRNNFESLECSCPTCSHYTLGYIHHLFKAKEVTAQILASVHNLHFMVHYMERVRTKIMNDQL